MAAKHNRDNQVRFFSNGTCSFQEAFPTIEAIQGIIEIGGDSDCEWKTRRFDNQDLIGGLQKNIQCHNCEDGHIPLHDIIHELVRDGRIKLEEEERYCEGYTKNGLRCHNSFCITIHIKYKK